MNTYDPADYIRYVHPGETLGLCLTRETITPARSGFPGPTGTIGRHVVDVLEQRAAKVRALTGDPASSNLPAGVEHADASRVQVATR